MDELKQFSKLTGNKSKGFRAPTFSLDSSTSWAIDYLVEHGYDDKMGARPMQRLIDDKIKKDLSKELLFGKLKQGGKVKVTADKKGIVLDYSDGVKLLEKQS